MESNFEKGPAFKIGLPQDGDEIGLAPMHIQAWKETYVGPDSGLTDEKVDEMLGHMLTNTDFRRNKINESLNNPDEVLYRVVKNASGEIVGFLHGSKDEQYNELDAIYLLNEVKGMGVGGKLMEEFLAWADESRPCRLEVFTFNDSTIGFYLKYGFVKTDKILELYKGFLPVTEMIRPAEVIGESNNV